MRGIWNWLLVEDHRKALGFIGAGIAAAIGAAWTVFVYLDKPTPQTPATQVTTPTTSQTQAQAPRENAEDQRLRQMLVGSWDGGFRMYPGNVGLNVRYTYNPDGTYSWVGEGGLFAVLVSGDWSIKDERITVTVRSSNAPAMVAVGSRYSSRVERLTQNSFTYVDQVTGNRVTDRRIN